MPEIEIPTSHHVDRNQFTLTRPALRDILREATAADHRRLDSGLGALPLDTVDGYRQFLEFNAAALLPLEDALTNAGVADLLPDWDLRRRTDAILSDLARLQGTPRLLDVPTLPDRAAMLGTLYVLEGSRLGAAYLLRNLARSNDPRIFRNTRFLSHGAGRQFWPSFLACLESHAEQLDTGRLVKSALRTFGLFEQSARVLS